MTDINAVNLNLLPILNALLQEQSITRAARRVGLSQPAVSGALVRLREHLEDPLLVRRGRRMVLTAKGESLRSPLEALITGVSEILSGSHRPAMRSRRVTIALNDYVEAALLPGVARAILETGSQVTIRIRRTTHVFEPPVAELESGACDLAVGFFKPELSSVTALRYRELWNEPRVCVCRRGNRKVKARISLEDYSSMGHVAIVHDESRPVVDRLLAAKRMQRHVVVLAQSILAAPRIVAGSDLLAILPERVVRHSGVAARLRTLPPPFALPPLPTTAVWHEQTQDEQTMALIRQLIFQAAARVK